MRSGSVPLKHCTTHTKIGHRRFVAAHCADSGALPDYLEKQGDVNKGTDYQTLLTSAVQLFRKLDEHKTWRWIPNSGTMCLTEADLRSVHECCVPV